MKVVIVKHTELSVRNMAILVHVQERKDVLNVIERDFDPQELDALRELIESERQLVVVVKKSKGRENIWESFLDLDADQIQNLLHLKHVKHSFLLLLSCHVSKKLIFWVLQLSVQVFRRDLMRMLVFTHER